MSITATTAPAAPADRVSLERAETASPQWSRRIAADVVGFLDVLAVVAGGMIPAAVYAAVGGMQLDWIRHLQVCLVAAVIVYGCLRHFAMYDTGRIHDFPVEPRRLAFSLALAQIALLGIGLPFAPTDAHLWVWYAAWLSTGFMMLLVIRCAARAVLARWTRAGAFDARIAVYGSGSVARRVEQHLRTADLGIRFAGSYDDRNDDSRIERDAPELTGNLNDLVAVARSGAIDRIIIALPQTAALRTAEIARRLEPLPVSLHIVTHIASDLVEAGPSHKVSSVGSVGLIDVKSKPLADWSRVVKALEDYVLASILLVLSLPVLVVIAVAIRLDSPGPVFFRQRRRGLNSRVFEVWKFRTMHVAEDGPQIRQARRDDPRVTRVGRFLRRSSLDELPQLFNVLRGEMSLVGPRPHALAHDDHFEETIARYANRQQVKPGITGLAQANGLRGETETRDKIERRLAMDLQYVNGWSLWLDLKILALTALRLVSARDAY
jgi:Undecaprenyl-phosphate glucose phosphotransferase